ncbi:MAG: arsenate reductase (glutaredoxin) [Planctomycetaceae bacterium]|nr:arsenate reductase (glutaredoxin) [Planctomycetaceae bacterium]
MTISVTIYHNPRCTKSRQTLELLRQHNVEPQVVQYLETPLSATELKRLVRMLGIDAAELLRTKEKLFREVFPEGTPSDAQAISLMAEHPRLMERPIVVVGDKAAIGRPPENILPLLQSQ